MREIAKKITRPDIIMAQGFPGGMNFPQHVPCPNRCRFCYEQEIDKLLPWVTVRCIRPFTDELFMSYLGKADAILRLKQKQSQSMESLSPFLQYKGKVYYFPKCDFFSLGLKQSHIELILRVGKPLTAYTTGLNVDYDQIKYLFKKYPHKFRLHFSIVTLDKKIRSEVMNPRIDLRQVRKICRIVKDSIFFLLFFNKRQMISDLKALNTYSLKNNNIFSMHKLFYNRISDPLIRSYVENSEQGFRECVDYLRLNNKRLKGISSRIQVTPDSKAYGWARRKEISPLLRGIKDREDSAVFCSQGISDVMRGAFKKAKVIPLKSCFGGNVDFVLGMTVKDVIENCTKLFNKGVKIKRIYLPDRMFSVSNKFDLNLDSISLIKKAFRGLEIHVVSVPLPLLKKAVSLDDCASYYSHHP